MHLGVQPVVALGDLDKGCVSFAKLLHRGRVPTVPVMQCQHTCIRPRTPSTKCQQGCPQPKGFSSQKTKNNGVGEHRPRSQTCDMVVLSVFWGLVPAKVNSPRWAILWTISGTDRGRYTNTNPHTHTHTWSEFMYIHPPTYPHTHTDTHKAHTRKYQT